MSRYAFTAMLAVLALSATALVAASSPKASKLTVQIAAQPSGSPSPEVCPATYPLRCPSLQCECVTFTGAFNGTLGHGTLSQMQLTVDSGDATPEKNCVPAFGVIGFPAGKRFGAISLDVAGAFCNSIAPNGKGSIGGGFDVDPMTSGVAGSGAMTGTQSGNAVRIKLSGFLEVSGSGTPTSSPSPTSTAMASPTSTGSPAATPTSTVGLPLGSPTPTSTSAASPTATSTSGLPLGL